MPGSAWWPSTSATRADRLRVRPGLGDEVDRDHSPPSLCPSRRAVRGCRARCAGPRARGTARRARSAAGRRCGGLRAQHFHHFADGAAAHVAARDAHGGAVAVHELAHLRRREENRRAAFVGHEKPWPSGWPSTRPATSAMRFATSRLPARFCTTSPARSELGQRALEFAPRMAWDVQPRRASSSRVSGARARSARRGCVAINSVAARSLPSPQRGSFRFFFDTSDTCN